MGPRLSTLEPEHRVHALITELGKVSKLLFLALATPGRMQTSVSNLMQTVIERALDVLCDFQTVFNCGTKSFDLYGDHGRLLAERAYRTDYFGCLVFQILSTATIVYIEDRSSGWLLLHHEVAVVNHCLFDFSDREWKDFFFV